MRILKNECIHRLEFESSSYIDGRLSAKVSFVKGEGSVRDYY